MIRRYLLAAPLAVACLFSSQAVYASPVGNFTPAHAAFARSMFSKSKTVKLSLRNESSSTMDFRAGDKIFTVEAGKTVTVDVPPGTRIVSNSATTTKPAGTLIVEVSSNLGGSTIILR